MGLFPRIPSTSISIHPIHINYNPYTSKRPRNAVLVLLIIEHVVATMTVDAAYGSEGDSPGSLMETTQAILRLSQHLDYVVSVASGLQLATVPTPAVMKLPASN